MNVKERCCGCIYLVEGDNGEWLCSDCNYDCQIKNIYEIPDAECSLMADNG